MSEAYISNHQECIQHELSRVAENVHPWTQLCLSFSLKHSNIVHFGNINHFLLLKYILCFISHEELRQIHIIFNIKMLHG